MPNELFTCGGDVTLRGTWDESLVVLSFITAVGGSFAGLECADRMRAAPNPVSRRRYFLAGATLIGVSIWTMHFVGMLAHQLGIPVHYDPALSAISVVAAAFGAGLAFLIVNRPVVTRTHVILGGIAMGLAIATMHYVGMASMQMPARIRYVPVLFAASVVLAIVASTGALFLAQRPIGQDATGYWLKASGALALGLAIAGMHYTGMAAACYIPVREIAAQESAVGFWSLKDLLIVSGVVIAGAMLALTAKNAAERQAALDSLEQKSTELVAASRAKDLFLASLSHELRTPLNPVLLLATDSAANPNYPPEARKAFADIAQGIALESRLIDDLLDLTRISRGILKMEPVIVDVHDIIEEAIEVVKPAMEGKNIRLERKLEALSRHAFADPSRLKQVFWNLLQNAVKFSEPGGTITVATEGSGESLEIRVTDAGLGMDPAELARCFDSFAQGRHQRGGLGMGLAISRSIIGLLGGTIAAASPGRGQGSSFVVTLKTVPAPTVPPPRSISYSAPPFAMPALAVLLVEDHEASRVVLKKLLQRQGHDVTAAATAGEALAAGRQRQFDLVVSDIGLPDQDGYELMQSLRRTQPVVGVALTGYGMTDDIRRAMESGFAAHVTKPVTAQQLTEALAKALAVRASQGATPGSETLPADNPRSPANHATSPGPNP
ncbi:MAG TPA: MHYT domain-containing protein [Lacunisphaera sp.]|nr:MHYT domain-containing protein [Lacunisphaera sp.]